MYRINGPYQFKTGTYLVGTSEIQLGTILNAGGWVGDFFHRLIVSPFLKRRRSTDPRQPLCYLRIEVIGTKDAPLMSLKKEAYTVRCDELKLTLGNLFLCYLIGIFSRRS